MRIYFAGGLEREEEQMGVSENHNLPFYRLLSFFYKKEVEKFLPAVKKSKKPKKKCYWVYHAESESIFIATKKEIEHCREDIAVLNRAKSKTKKELRSVLRELGWERGRIKSHLNKFEEEL